MDKKKVVVGLSGGVDSAVAALLLKKEGYEVIGVTMKQFASENFSEDAKAVADVLGIEHLVLDMVDDFKKSIMDYFVSEYEKGRTPNPCTMCNPLVKWEALIRVADKVGAYYVATGHYANIDKVGDRYSIKNAKTALKDQTYALCNLSQEQLQRTLMPLGGYEKEEVRKLAKEAGIPVADKKDSQDICFIPDGDYGRFLEEYTGKKSKKGNFVDVSGKILGPHEGIDKYTIGQRKGLGIAMGHPVFVVAIRPETCEVVIGENDDLFTTDFTVSNMNFMCGTKEKLPAKLVCKIRYAHKGTECELSKAEDGKWSVHFLEPVRAITPGQTAVFYEGEYVFGAGAID